ncbi:hypothetical protein LTR47_009642 [Exophiala xenobiotica]|nr:hypothetical protein LTR47_009642 [Exophiala xenobiotica]KAK5247114.1 hypothetical protein LTS06_007651 [Exophiala xenobiotica]KAK5345042.1 hypothetical protein LTR61_011178 [Exophiala xenobiotica]KAK5358227.1 hypothetical protein LTR11_011051 [Exophiala xenobiotica]KAK5359446.1 hypothetical protein LTS03_011000 [Exophiala xenobiotica]
MATLRGRRPSSPGDQVLYDYHIHTLQSRPRPHLTFTDEPPNEQSVGGQRHDNDREDYRKMKILPTIDEILAVDSPIYMPKKDLRWAHPLPTGPGRHLDSLFRQLRCDSFESIRDICYTAAQLVFLNVNPTGQPHPIDRTQNRHETVAGNRFFLYRDVNVEELLAHEHKAMLVRTSYHCPSFMRGHKLYHSSRFQEGMLVALLQLNHMTNELSVFFLGVSLSQSTFSMDSSNGGGQRAAVQLAFLPTTTRQEILQLSRHALGLCAESQLALVEFPKVLFAGFYNCLKRLQEMKETDFAFRTYIAPEMQQEEAFLAMQQNHLNGRPPIVDCPPPVHARAPGFKYDLSTVLSPTSRVRSMSVDELARPSSIDILQRETTLDEGQAIAFRDSLLREFAFTQGPPGCGKTFLGVQLAKALLQSRPTPKPILLVCLTNHALDSFLEDLRDAGVTGLVRIGGGSKEEWTNSINLKSLKRKTRLSKEDGFTMSTNITRKKETFADLDIMCKAVSSKLHTRNLPWQYVEDILFEKYPEHHAQLSTNAPSVHAKAFTFEYWSGGGDLESIRDLHVELATRLNEVSLERSKTPSGNVDDILMDISYFAKKQSHAAGENSLWSLPISDRQRLLRQWDSEVDRERFAAKLTALYFEFQDTDCAIKALNSEREISILEGHNVIGMTTTACATRWEQLLCIGIETTLCEEAAEVMEAHTLCSLLPTTKHAILIGDPLQLRPETNEQMLTLETRVGMEYRLDESLLERLMLPRDPSASAVPVSQLNIQRRMHPEIANITRITYPYLRDHESTLDRLPTHGLVHRMFWWDHRIPEMDADDLKSHVNLYEVEMVAGLVNYLLRGGAYDQGDIAILTPYCGQLSKLHERLSATCDIWLSEKDRELLLDESLVALGAEGRGTKDEVPMSDMLRMATVDNFQGEEARVIILSTVRSGGSAGFLKTINRINVACSRARDGFYTIGLKCGHACPSLHGEVCPPSELCPTCASGSPPNKAMLYLPDCGHLVDIDELDWLNLRSVYELAPDGSVRSINSAIMPADLQAPKCRCGVPCAKTRRYMNVAKLVDFQNTLDRLVAKMGRKMHKYATAIDVVGRKLDETFDPLVGDIRPNPLATKTNTGLILRRYREILDVQKDIVKHRQEVIDCIQSQIAKAHDAFPNIARSYDLKFHSHFDALEYRVIGIRIQDTVRMANHLLGLQDPSFGVQRQGMKMLEYVHKESLARVDHCQNALNNDRVKTSPMIDAEIRLHQVQFSLFAKATKSKLSALGTTVEGAVSATDDTAIKGKLDEVMEICEHYPDTHKLLMDTTAEFIQAIDRADVMEDTICIPKVKTRGVREIEKLWAQHEVGSLKVCAKSHVYSTKTFPQGCPECGRKVMTDRELYQKSSKHLFEDRFLTAMRARGGSAQPLPPAEPEKKLTNEEKFLEAMKKIGKK